MQLLDLPDRDGAIGAIKDAFDETALRVPRAIGKLRHAKRFCRNLSRTSKAV
jgi:hypothetical protein